MCFYKYVYNYKVLYDILLNPLLDFNYFDIRHTFKETCVNIHFMISDLDKSIINVARTFWGKDSFVTNPDCI